MATSTSTLGGIKELQSQLETLKRQAIDEVKQQFFDARKLATTLEELASLTGREAADASRTTRAVRVGWDALRIRKFIKNNPKILKRQGSGQGTKFFLQ